MTGGERPSAGAAAEPGADWRDGWHPVAFERDLDASRPFAFSLFGEPFVLFRGADGAWFCGPDRCPHRAARLSEGTLRDGRLECLYHGWQFGADGACVRIPQWPRDKDLPRAACLQRHPVEVRQGIVWVCPGDRAVADARGMATIADLDVEGVTVVDYQIDLPYGQSFLVENVLDVAHIHIAHDGLRGGGHRELALPLAFEILADTPKGLKATYRSLGLDEPGAAPRGRALVEYVAPHLVHYSSDFGDASRIAGLALYSLPLAVDRCRLLYRKYSNYYSWRERIKPRWLEHWTQNEILRQDMSLLVGQHDEIRRAKGELADLWLPIRTSDFLVVQFRKWLDQHAPGRPDHIGFRTHRPAPLRAAGDEDVHDVMAMHTRQCRDCTAMWRAVQRARAAAGIAAFAALPAMLLGADGLRIAALAAYALAAASWWALGRLQRRFERTNRR